jgi:tetratricopeptide (TPR) repeat protein
MMIDTSFCPQCSQRIETERRREAVVVCANCGYVASAAEQKQSASSHQSFIFASVAFVAIVIGAMAQISAWDNYWLEVIPLEVKEMTGTSKPADLARMVDICLERHRYTCAEDGYSRLSKKDPAQLVKLGKLQMSRTHYKEAADSFRQFFSVGGKDLDASFQYARVLKQIGKVEEAGKYYRYIARAGTDSVMRAAAQDEIDKLHRKTHIISRGIASVPTTR